MTHSDQLHTQSNVLVVLCDQMGDWATSYAGDPNVQTPVIDSLAADGVRFDNAYATYPICVPSRYTMVTGRYAHRDHVPTIGWAIPTDQRTIAHRFGDAGYQTAYIGKWHLSNGLGNQQYAISPDNSDHDDPAPVRSGFVPPGLQGGFDYWRGFELRNDHHDTYYFKNDDPKPRSIDGYQTDGLTDLTIEYLESADEPFFTVLSVEPPHPPYEAPESFEQKWKDRELKLRPNVDFDSDRQSIEATGLDRWDDLTEALRSYYAMIENLDYNLGRLIETLQETNLREDTAIVFTSDHGDMMGAHGLMKKSWPYEESASVPFIVSQPGTIDSGRVISEPICTEDWFPTFLGLAGLKYGETDGKDLSPVLRGEKASLNREGVYLEYYAELRNSADEMPAFDFARDPWRGFVTERYKYTVKGGIEGATPWQFFDLHQDPYEQNNLVENPEFESRCQELHGLLRERLMQTNDNYVLQPAFDHPGVNNDHLPLDR